MQVAKSVAREHPLWKPEKKHYVKMENRYLSSGRKNYADICAMFLGNLATVCQEN